MSETTVIFDNLTLLRALESLSLETVWEEAASVGLNHTNAFLTQNGRLLPASDKSNSVVLPGGRIEIHPRLRGGKGGFGSMLRAIGAQIEKTTNREACRDLSGRRLKDINEEKRLREWLERQKEEPEDPSEKFQRKISKLLAKPKHEFKDEVYYKQRSELTSSMDDAVEMGMKRIQEGGIKRPAAGDQKDVKKAKGAVWTGLEDLSSSSEDDDESSDDDFEDETMKNILQLYLRERTEELGLEVAEENKNAKE